MTHAGAVWVNYFTTHQETLTYKTGLFRI